jgi:hypothetical protein
MQPGLSIRAVKRRDNELPLFEGRVRRGSAFFVYFNRKSTVRFFVVWHELVGGRDNQGAKSLIYWEADCYGGFNTSYR